MYYIISTIPFELHKAKFHPDIPNRRCNINNSVNMAHGLNMDNSYTELAHDFVSIWQIYRQYGEKAAETRVLDLIVTRKQDFYADKLVHLAVIDIIFKKCQDEAGYVLRLPAAIMEALKNSEEEISLICIIAKHADLCVLDYAGKKPVDYILDLITSYYAMQEVDIKDENVLKLLCSLINDRILNLPYKFGNSYFGLFVKNRWWKLVEWGLNNGADVSDNGVCDNIPLDLIFQNNSSRHPKISVELFSRLLHPTNVNRPLNVPMLGMGTQVVPLVAIGLLPHHRPDLFIPLLEAGASIDVPNNDGQLPMAVYAEKMSTYGDPDFFNQLIPKCVGIKAELFLKLLLDWVAQGTISRRETKPLIFAIFPQRLMLSSGMHELEMQVSSETCLSKDNNQQNKTKMFLKGSDLEFVSVIIDILTACGIRPRSVAQFIADTNDRHEHQEKWNNYRTFIPSLALQSVRTIRSSMQLVTEERIHELPLPKVLKEMILMKKVMEDKLERLHSKLHAYHEN